MIIMITELFVCTYHDGRNIKQSKSEYVIQLKIKRVIFVDATFGSKLKSNYFTEWYGNVLHRLTENGSLSTT